MLFNLVLLSIILQSLEKFSALVLIVLFVYMHVAISSLQNEVLPVTFETIFLTLSFFFSYKAGNTYFFQRMGLLCTADHKCIRH